MLISATPEALLSASSSGSDGERLTLSAQLQGKFGDPQGTVTMVAINTADVLSYVFCCSEDLPASGNPYIATFDKSSIPDRFWPVLAKLDGSYSLSRQDEDRHTFVTVSFSTGQLEITLGGINAQTRTHEFLLCTVSAE